MAKILRDLLDATEPVFSLSLRQLEKASGSTGVDSRLIGKISHKMRESLEELGLDPEDSTGHEVYRALLSKVAEDNLRVTNLLGGDDPDDVTQMVPLMVKAVANMKINKQCWVLKHSVAKKLLSQMPPEKLMAHLGYKSLDSMLKHEDIDEVYTALRFSEGAEWLNQYNELFKTVTPSDFEVRDIRIIVMDHKKYVDLATKFVEKKLHNITHTKEMGTIVVVPMHRTHMKGITLKSLPLIFHYINEVRLYSAFFKLKQVNKNFGETVVQTLIADPGDAASMAGQNVHWRVIQRYFGKIKDANFPEAFEPHVHPEDLHWRKANELLVEFDPEMKFWLDKDYVGKLYDGSPVTLNLMDVSLGYSNGNSYDDRLVYHFRESLWNEIFMSYMGKKNLEEQILNQLDNDMIVPSKLTPPKQSKSTASKLHQIKAQSEIRKKLIDSAEGRLVGVTEEFEQAFDVLEKHHRTVTIFGSARTSDDTTEYSWAYDVASALAAEGYTIVTGGGYGMMEAANKGAIETGGQSLGFNINLPTEQKLNSYVTASYEFEHFFGRKVVMTLDARAYIYMPGGFGTLDELFEIVTLAQTGKIPRVPIILFGSEFWNPLMEFIHTVLYKKFKTIDAIDKKLFTITDSVDEVITLVNKHVDDVHTKPKGSMPNSRKASKS